MKGGIKHLTDRSEKGFSIVELLLVFSIIAILSTMVVFYASAHKRMYAPDEEAIELADLLQEARQRALNQRRTMRVEVNLTTNQALLYDENTDSTTASDDIMVRGLVLVPNATVRIDTRPSEIPYNPPEPIAVPNAVFESSIYPSSVGNNVATIRFLSTGQAVNAGTSPFGTGSVPTSVSLHIWSPNSTATSQSEIARCLTILGTTGAVRLWEFDRNSTASNKWKDSRRSSNIR